MVTTAQKNNKKLKSLIRS